MKVSHWLLAATLSLAPLPAFGQPAGDRVDLEVAKSRVLEISQKITRVSISDPTVADVTVLSRNGILVSGKKQGTASLIVWTADKRRTEYDVSVKVDTVAIQTALQQALASEDVHAEYRNEKLVISGTVHHAALVARAGKVAEGLTAGPILNLVQATAVPTIQVEVQVSELVTSGGHDAGVSWGSIRMKPSGEWVFLKDLMTFAETGGPPFGAQNILSFGQFDRLAAEMKMLATEGKARVLAEPKLAVVSGASASVLVGGEFPVPTVQALGQIAVTWRGYGVKLEISPQILPDGRVSLKVRPEVSALDYNNSIKIADWTLPSLRTRTAETYVVMAPGEGLAIGGLTQETETTSVQKFPFLGDIPVLGALFSHNRMQKETTELLILVSPKLVNPSRQQTKPSAGRMDAPKDELARPEPRRPEPARPEVAKPEPARQHVAKPEPRAQEPYRQLGKPGGSKVEPAKPGASKVESGKSDISKVEPGNADASKVEPGKPSGDAAKSADLGFGDVAPAGGRP